VQVATGSGACLCIPLVARLPAPRLQLPEALDAGVVAARELARLAFQATNSGGARVGAGRVLGGCWAGAGRVLGGAAAAAAAAGRQGRELPVCQPASLPAC
jgi:hypothetical protein